MEADASSGAPHRTLGDILYASLRGPLAPEAEWRRLAVRAADRDGAALDTLYEFTHRAVFTLLVRITCSREIAEELTFALYREMGRPPALSTAEGSTVAASIMNRARSMALARLRSDQRKSRGDSPSDRSLIMLDMPDYRDLLRFRHQAGALRAALAVLDRDEREAIETVYFRDLGCEEAADFLDCAEDVVTARLRDGMRKLARALGRSPDGGGSSPRECEGERLAGAYALHALPENELRQMEEHLAACGACRREAEALGPVVDTFVAWPADLLRPPRTLWRRLAEHFAGPRDLPLPRAMRWSEREWESVAPDISCKLLADDAGTHLVSMLVRLAPGGEYPPHIHAAREELHLLDGELWIDERKLYPGDYNSAEAGTRDRRVWSETGCTCLLVTSARDILG